MAVIFLLVTVTLAYTVQTAVTDPGKDLRFPVVKKSSRDLLRLQNSLLLWIPEPLLASFHHGRSLLAITKSQSISTSTRCLVTIGITPLLANYDTNTDVSLDMIFSQIPVKRKLRDAI